MAIVKAGKPGKSLGDAINYAAKDMDNGGVTGGINCSDDPRKAAEEMQVVKEYFGQEGGRQYKSYIHSYKGDEVTPEKALEITKEWAEKEFAGHQVFIGVDHNTDNVHCHVIVNSVNIDDGKKIHLSNDDLQKMKDHSNELCREKGLSVPEKTRERGDVSAWDMDKYQVMKKSLEKNEPSYIVDTATAVERAAKTAKNRDEFVEKMNEQGYKVNWESQKKHITFTNADGHKVRAANLEKTFNEPAYNKDGLNERFSINKNREIERERQRERQQQQPPVPAPLARQKIDNTIQSSAEIEHRMRNDEQIKQQATHERAQAAAAERARIAAAAQSLEAERTKAAERAIAVARKREIENAKGRSR